MWLNSGVSVHVCSAVLLCSLRLISKFSDSWCTAICTLVFLFSYSKDFQPWVLSSACPKPQHFPICGVQCTENFPNGVLCYMCPWCITQLWPTHPDPLLLCTLSALGSYIQSTKQLHSLSTEESWYIAKQQIALSDIIDFIIKMWHLMKW